MDGTVEIDGTLTGSLSLDQSESLVGKLSPPQTVKGGLTIPKVGPQKPIDYDEDIINRPRINDEELIGNKTFEELGDHILTNIEIKQMFDRIFKGGH